MIEVKTGNLLASSAFALVNPVNCVGAMGAGLAQTFRRAFPAMYNNYLARCARGEVRTGALTTFRERDKLIINFPTKVHWRDASRPDYIDAGLKALRRLVTDEKVRSMAIPALGCGLGGLQWDDVQPRIRAALVGLSGVHIELYAPLEQPGRQQFRAPRHRRRSAGRLSPGTGEPPRIRTERQRERQR